MKRILSTEEACDYLDAQDTPTEELVELRDATRNLLARGELFAVDRDDRRGVTFIHSEFRSEVEKEIRRS